MSVGQVYALSHVFELFKTDHSIGRKIALFVQALYNMIMLVFSWFSLGNFYIFFVSTLGFDACVCSTARV